MTLIYPISSPRFLKASAVSAIAFAAMMQAFPAFAIDKIYSPNVVKHELEVEYSGDTSFDNDHSKNNVQGHEIELEYGLTDRVMLELAGAFAKDVDQSVKSEGVGIGGRYQFFEQGENWLDAGLLLSYGIATQSHSPDSIEAKLLLEKQTGPFLHRANIGIEQEVGDNAQGGSDRVFLWNSRYRYNEHFEPGFEIQSDFGKPGTGNFDRQEHYIGPAAYGEILPNLKYEAAYYFGVSDAAAKGAARALLEYEMFF